MRTTQIAGTSVTVSEVAFGGASLGNLYRETSEADAAAAVAQAWRSGIRYFDTAPHYGLGLSERRLGAALAEYPREQLVISTKVGRLIVRNERPTEFDTEGFAVPGDLRRQWDFSRDGVLRSVEASLKRLGTDYIDILYLHDPDVAEADGGEGAAGAAIEGAAALIELREQGIVRAVGIGSNDASAVASLFERSDIDLAMLAGRYTLLEQRGADAVFEAANGRSIVAVGVFNSGLLANDRPAPDATYNYAPAPAELLARANQLADVCEAHGVTLPQAAIAFPLRNPGVAAIAVGVRNAEQVAHNLSLYEDSVPDALWDDLHAQGLLEE